MREPHAITFDLDLYPTLKRFALSKALVRIVIGPAGSAKTSYAILEILRLAMNQEVAPDGVRYSKALIIRKTYDRITKNTISSMQRMLGPLLKITNTTPPSGLVRFELADKTIVNLEFDFLSMDSPQSEDKLLGAEPTYILFDELSEFTESHFTAALKRLGRYPSMTLGKPTQSCMFATTNGPKEKGWIWQWEHDKDKIAKIAEVSEDYMRHATWATALFEIFHQPPALLRGANGKWVPNPLAENVHTYEEGYGYWYTMLLESNDAKIQSYVEGKYAAIEEGEVVWPEFKRSLHVVPAMDTSLVDMVKFSFDFGRTPVCLCEWVRSDGSSVVIREWMMKNASVKDLILNKVIPDFKRDFPHNPTILTSYGDPAGQVEGQAISVSPFGVLIEHGFPMRVATTNNQLEQRLEAVRQRLTTLTRFGKPLLTISESCPMLIKAVSETYVYVEEKGNTIPTKSHEEFVSDLADALQYSSLGAIIIGDSEVYIRAINPSHHYIPTTQTDIKNIYMT